MTSATAPPPLDPLLLATAAESLRVVAHPVRLQLLDLLTAHQAPVTELAALAGIAQPVASQHLRLLARAGVVTAQREGHTVYYRVIDAHVLALLACMRGHAPATKES